MQIPCFGGAQAASRTSGATTRGQKLGLGGNVDNVPIIGVITPPEYWNYHGIPNWIFHIHIQSGSCVIPALHLYPIWPLGRVVLAHDPDATIALVSDMEAQARPRQGVVHHAHMFSHCENGYGPGSQVPRPLVLGPYPLWLNICA